jgi:hypothetical protein
VSVLFFLLTFIERLLLLGIGIFDQSNVLVPVKQLLMHAPAQTCEHISDTQFHSLYDDAIVQSCPGGIYLPTREEVGCSSTGISLCSSLITSQDCL